MLIISKYINRIRNDHTRAIEERQNHFGIKAEKLNVLKVTKRCLTDSFKLYIGTVALMTIITLIGIIELFLNKAVVPVKIFFILTLHVNDVAIIASTKGEIRIEMKSTFCICCYRNVAPLT